MKILKTFFKSITKAVKTKISYICLLRTSFYSLNISLGLKVISSNRSYNGLSRNNMRWLQKDGREEFRESNVRLT